MRTMIPPITDQAAFQAALEPHLVRLRVASEFPSIEARWSGREASEFAGLLDEMARWIDKVGFELVSAAKARLAAARGVDAREDYRRAMDGKGAGFRAVVTPCSDILRRGAGPGLCACFRGEGIPALLGLSEDLAERVFVLIPRRVAEIDSFAEAP